MTYTLTLGAWDEQKTAAREVRQAVFIIEQGVPVDMEWDDMDDASLHAVVFGGKGEAIATGRLLPDGHIGRMAVMMDERGRGLGGKVLRALIGAATERGDREVVLHAQTHAEKFYERFGFFREGEEFVEAGIPHIMMRCAIRR